MGFFRLNRRHIPEPREEEVLVQQEEPQAEVEPDILSEVMFLSPRLTKLGQGVMASPRISSRPSVHISFRGQISETHKGGFFSYCTHT